ncbi:MAG: OmpA family protein [Alcanivorax sp.]|jgi:outer membrane protein OmpA-like peptidoglycan-associated protein
MFKRTWPVWAFLALAGTAQALQAPAFFNHETVIDSRYQTQAARTLQTAPVRYIDEEHRQGYASGGEIEVSGRIRRFVLDHPRADSDLSIVAHYRDRLRAAGYRIAYQCDRGDCGDAPGWRLLLGDGVVGDTGAQHYLLAHRGDRAERGEYVAVYVNEIDDLPRSVVLSVEQGRLDRVRSLPAEGERHRLFYSLNDTRLSLRDRLALGRVAARLRDNPDVRVEITGFADGDADQTGLQETNQSLARRRADLVAALLADQLTESAAARVINHGGQVRVPEPGQQPGQWRRVDLSLQRVASDDQTTPSQGEQDDDSNPV